MTVRTVSLVAALLLGAHNLAADPPLSPSAQLIKDVVYNELHDRARQSLWMYHVEKRIGGQTLSEIQVETVQGPVFRTLAINGAPLNAQQRKEDDDRIDHIFRDPGLAARLKQQHESEEKRLENMVQLLPEEYIFAEDGSDGANVRLKFQPNPDYHPTAYEARALHALAGTVLVNRDHKRLAAVAASLVSPVDYGFGLFGHLDQGGTLKLNREQVFADRWKSTSISVHVSGRIVLFKSLNKDQDEKRSGFQPLADGTTLQDARQLLYR